MKRKILVTVLAMALLMIFAAVPVMAAPATRILITATQIGGGGDYSNAKMWLVDDGIYQFRGILGSGVIVLHLPPALGGELVGTSTSIVDGVNKFDHPEPGPWPNAECLWHLDMTFWFAGGTFEGMVQRKQIGYPVPSVVETHAAFQGTGDYEGWTLVLSGTRGAVIPSQVDWEGFLIMR